MSRIAPARSGPATVLLVTTALLGAAIIGPAFQARGATHSASARRSSSATAKGPRLVIASSGGAERVVEVRDLSFVYFRRTYYQMRSPRAEDAAGRRIDVEDRRREDRSVRFEDESKARFYVLRQIEITYPEGGREALVRLTWRDGRMREVPAGSLAGGSSQLPPRFAATVDGALREFPLLLGDAPDERWPEERLVRILFVPTPLPPRPKR